MRFHGLSRYLWINLFWVSFGAWADVEVSGFADVQYQWRRGAVELTESASVAGSSNSFSIHQAAVCFSSSQGRSRVFVDLPFFQDPQQSSTSNTFAVGEVFAQAFIAYKSDSYQWVAGQFDSPFGFEGNDTPGLAFTDQGILFSLSPTTHTGFLLTLPAGTWSHRILLGNSNQLGEQDEDRSMEVGVQSYWEGEQKSLAFGLIRNQSEGDYSLSNGARRDYEAAWFFDLMASFQWDLWSLDLNYEIKQPEEAKYFADTEHERSLIQGLLVQVGYQLSSQSSLHLRSEGIVNDVANEFVQQSGVSSSGEGSIWERTTFSYNRQLNDALTLKAQASHQSIQVSEEAERAEWWTGTLSAVHTF